MKCSGAGNLCLWGEQEQASRGAGCIPGTRQHFQLLLSDHRHFHLPVLPSRSGSLVLFPMGTACCSFLHPTISQHPRSRVLMRLDPSFKMSLSILCHPITQPAWYLIACKRGGLGLAGMGECSWSFWVSALPCRAVFFLFFSFFVPFLSFFYSPLGFELLRLAFSSLLDVVAGQNLFKLTA